MKKIISVILVLALTLSAGALAEETAAQEVAAQTVVTDEKNNADEKGSALTEALELFKALKGSTRVKSLDTLKQELEGYVTAGKLTQEQADLILKYYTEQSASRGQKSSKSQTLQRGERRNSQGRDQQPTNNGQQGQQTPQGKNGGGQPNGGQQNGEGTIDTTTGATSQKGK